ncbi:hypothetical protein E1H12_20855 [Geitlerinema sp. P-1104]|nr:hypothetical protein [Geitlerinema sp. P-1104]
MERRLSRPRLPKRKFLPWGPPMRTSSPPRPAMVSPPRSPTRVSLPPPPTRMFLPPWEMRRLLPSSGLSSPVPPPKRVVRLSRARR